jgi:hypothetical protein
VPFFSKIVRRVVSKYLRVGAGRVDKYTGKLPHTLFGRYLLGVGSIVQMPFCLGRTVRGTSFEDFELDPFGVLVNEYKGCFMADKAGFTQDLQRRICYEAAQTIGDAGILLKNSKYLNYPLWSVAMPWDDVCIEYQYQSYLDALYKNRHDVSPSIWKNTSFEREVDFIYSQEFSLTHAIQFNTIEQIHLNSTYDEFNNPIAAFLLVKEGEFRWIMGYEGNHRAYIAYSRNFKSHMTRIVKVINYSEATHWTNVASGLYSLHDAQSLFDKIWEGKSVIRGLV